MNNEPVHTTAGSDEFIRDEFIRRNIGDIELCRDVARIFFDNGPEYLQAIRSALEMHDSEAVRQSSHKLKGAAANLSLPKVAETAALIETAAKNNTLDTIEQLMPELEHRFSLAKTAVHELLPPPSPYQMNPKERHRHEYSDC